MREHPFEQPGKPVLGHCLKAIGEVATVIIHTRSNPGADARIELGRVKPPLLARIAPDELVVEVATNAAHHDVFRGPDVFHCLCDRREVRCARRIVLEIKPVKLVHRRPGYRHREKLPINFGKYPMLIWTPFGELREVIHNSLRVGMEDVWTISMNQDA